MRLDDTEEHLSLVFVSNMNTRRLAYGRSTMYPKLFEDSQGYPMTSLMATERGPMLPKTVIHVPDSKSQWCDERDDLRREPLSCLSLT